METPGPQEPRRDQYNLLWYWDNSTRSWTRYPPGQQNDPDWSHATGGDNDLFATDQNPLGTWEKTKNPMGEGITAGFFPSEEDANEARGGRNWETNNVRLWMMNEQPTMQQAMQIVGSGGTPDDLENWVIQDYLAQHNQDHLQDAQDWNSMPERERLDRDYEGLPDGAKNIVDNLFGGPNVGDVSANVIDPGLVDWNSLFQDVQTWIQEEQDDMTREAAAGFNDEGMPWSEEEWQNYQNNNDVAFNRKYEINPNDYSASLQGLIEMGKEQIDNALQGGDYQFENGNINPVDKLNQLRHIAEDFASRAADQVFNNPQYAQTFVTENPSLMERPKDLFGNPEKDELDWPEGDPTEGTYKNFEDVWPDGKAVGNSNLFRIIADSLDQYIDSIEQQGNYMPMARVAGLFGWGDKNKVPAGPAFDRNQFSPSPGLHKFFYNGPSKQVHVWQAPNESPYHQEMIGQLGWPGEDTGETIAGRMNVSPDFSQYDLMHYTPENNKWQPAATQAIQGRMNEMYPGIQMRPWGRQGNYTDTIQTPEPMDQDDMVVSHPPDCPCEKCQFSREMDKQQQVHPRTEPFQNRVPHRNRTNYDDSFPSMISKTAEYEEDSEDMYDDEPQEPEEPQDEDAIISAKGEVWFDGKLLGVVGRDFPNEEDAYYPLYQAMEQAQFWPDVWQEDDHGGYTRLDGAYFNHIVKKEDKRLNTDWDKAEPSTYRWPTQQFTVGDIVRRLFSGYQIGTIIDGPRWNLEMTPYSEDPAPDGMYREYLVSWEPQRQQYQYREKAQYPEGNAEWTPEAYLEATTNQERGDTPEQEQQMVTQARTAAGYDFGEFNENAHLGPGIYNSMDIPVDERPSWTADCPECGNVERISPSWHGPIPPGSVPCGNCGHFFNMQTDFRPETDASAPAVNDLAADTPEQIHQMVTQGKTAEYSLTDTGAFYRVPWFVNPNTGEIEMAAPNAGHATMPNYDALYRDPTGPRPPAVGEFLNGKLHHYEGSNQSYGLDQQLRAKYNDHRQMFPEIPPLMYDRVHDYQETPDANPFPQIKLLGSEMSDDVKQPHEWRHVFDKFAWEDAQPDLASCNKCASPMIDKGAEKICHTCGNRQPIIYANRSGGALDGLGGAAALAAPWLLGPEVGAPVDAAELGAGAAAAGGGGGLGGLMGNIMGTGGNMLKMKGLESIIGGDPSGGDGGQQPPDTMDYEPGTVAHTAASDDGVGLAVKDDGQDVNPNIHSTDGNTNLDGDDPSHVKDHDLSSGAEGAKAELHQTVEQIMEHLLGLGEGEGQSSPIAQALDKLLEAMNPGYRGESPDATIMIDAIPEESAVGTESDSDSESSNDEPAHPDKVAALPGGNPQAVKALVDQYVEGAIDSGTLQRLLQDLKVQMGGSASIDSGMPSGNMGYEMGDEMNPMGQPLSHVANLPMVPQQPGGSVPVMQQGPASMGDATEMGGPCEICGGAHNSAMHGAASPGGQGMHAVSNKVARRPKLCPYHSDLIDYSLQFGDPKEALGIIAPQQYGSQWCKSGEFRATCNFKPTMVKQEYWDQRENELQQRRFEREQETLLQQQEAPISQDEEIAEFSDMDSGSEGYTPAEVTDISAVGAPMEMAARTSAWTDANGNPLIEGQHYKLQSPKYDAADEVIIKDTKSPNKLVVEIKSDLGISYEDEITPESVANNGFQFMPDPRPESEHSEFSPETNNEYPFYDEPGGVSDVSDLPTPVSHMSEPETDSLSYLMQDTGQFDGVDPVTVAKVAGKDFSHNEQMNFINEAGLARNIEELDLSGSHYGPLDGYLHDINDEFSMGW